MRQFRPSNIWIMYSQVGRTQGPSGGSEYSVTDEDVFTTLLYAVDST
jgi:hypothetical protein